MVEVIIRCDHLSGVCSGKMAGRSAMAPESGAGLPDEIGLDGGKELAGFAHAFLDPLAFRVEPGVGPIDERRRSRFRQAVRRGRHGEWRNRPVRERLLESPSSEATERLGAIVRLAGVQPAPPQHGRVPSYGQTFTLHICQEGRTQRLSFVVLSLAHDLDGEDESMRDLKVVAEVSYAIS